MIFPTLYNAVWVDSEGKLTPESQTYQDELIQALQAGLSDNGWTTPNVTKDELAKINALTGLNAMPNGTFWYVTDSSTGQKFVFKINGALFEFAPGALQPYTP